MAKGGEDAGPRAAWGGRIHSRLKPLQAESGTLAAAGNSKKKHLSLHLLQLRTLPPPPQPTEVGGHEEDGGRPRRQRGASRTVKDVPSWINGLVMA